MLSFKSCVVAGAGDLFTPAEKSMSQRAVDHLMGWRVLGQRHKEHILPVGATITAVGELAHSSADGSACKGAIPFGGAGSVLVLQVRPRTCIHSSHKLCIHEMT